MKKQYEQDKEYYNIYRRDYDAKIKEKKNAPRFRSYIKLLIDCIDMTEEELDKEIQRRYKQKFYKKKNKNK